MLVDEHDLAVVDGLAQGVVDLERHAASQCTGFGQLLVEIVAQAGTGDQGDLARGGLGQFGQGLRHRLGFTGAGETAHADGHAVLDQLGSFGCGGDFFEQIGQADTITVHGRFLYIRRMTNTVRRV
ncbi:hypothetical protein D3C78_1414470 [compost metagenome]